MVRRASPAFTLLELLVALFITGLCLALVSMSFAAVYRAHARAREHMELQQTLDETMARIRSLLQTAYLSPYPENLLNTSFETMDLDNLSNPYDAITFSTLSNTSHRINAKQSNLEEVTIFAKPEPPLETPKARLKLARLRIRVGGSINSRFEVQGGTLYTLADHLTGFHLEYLNQAGEWKPEWIPGDNGNNLPCAVRVTIGLRSETLQEQEESMIVPLEMTALRCKFEDDRIFKK